jgi:hypothetical protein
VACNYFIVEACGRSWVMALLDCGMENIYEGERIQVEKGMCMRMARYHVGVL